MDAAVPVSVARATIAGLLVQAILYGVYAMLFLSHVKILWRRRSSRRVYYYTLATAISLFLTITVTTGLDIALAIANIGSSLNPGTMVPSLLCQVRSGMGISTMLIADLYLVFRVYTVWGKDWRIAAFPLVLWAVLLGMFVWCQSDMANAATAPDQFSTPKSTLSDKFPLLFTIALNGICTVLIAGKLWTHVMWAQSLGDSGLSGPISSALVIVVESASVYMAWLIAMTVLRLKATPWFFCMFSITIPLVGIVFTSIIVRACEQDHATAVVSSSICIAKRDVESYPTNSSKDQSMFKTTTQDSSSWK